MFSTRSEYDRRVNTFSPEGRLFQVEYALGAIKLGSTALGFQTSDGVLLASERRITSPLIEFESTEKIMEIDSHIACAMSGLLADAKTLVDHGRVECANHFFTYSEPLSVQSSVDAIASLALNFTDSGSGQKKTLSRPFGVALLVAGVDSTGPSLWCTDPSGTNTKYSAVAIGIAQEGADSILNESYKADMSFKEVEDLALVILRQVMEEKLTSSNVEVARVMTSDSKYHKYDQAEIQALIDRLPPSTTSPAELMASSISS